MNKQAFKPLKWFSLEWDDEDSVIRVHSEDESLHPDLRKWPIYKGYFITEQQAFDWLEANGYIEKIKESV